MAYTYQFYPNTYRDSVALMQISAEIEILEGISQASLVMATAANIALLREVQLIEREIAPRNNDLMLVIKGKTKKVLDTAILLANSRLFSTSPVSNNRGENKPNLRTIEMGIKEKPKSNLALISCPGEYAIAETIKALNLGLNVMLFSDNIKVDDEALLKSLARKKNRILMGPDCGTAIIDGIPLGFANKVAKGNIGIIGASGTGLQQVSCLIDLWGGGISQAIGTGGRDLHEQIGAATTMVALDRLGTDPDTHVIIIISKPPSAEVAEKIINRATSFKKPIVISFLSDLINFPNNNKIIEALDLEAAAYAAIKLTGVKHPALKRHLIPPKQLKTLIRSVPTGRRYLRGLYSGGTFGFEAMFLLQNVLKTISSSTPNNDAQKLDDPWKSSGHTILDLGADDFTRGRPHPMIDHRLRNERIVMEAQDPETAIILFDVVLGYGSHPNPAKDLSIAIKKVRDSVEHNCPLFVGFVCGTKNDPQILQRQENILIDTGVILAKSNAQAVKLASDIILGIEANLDLSSD